MNERGRRAEKRMSDLAGRADIRWMACHALGAIGPKAAKAVPALVKAADDAHPDVREVARAAFQKVQKVG